MPPSPRRMLRAPLSDPSPSRGRRVRIGALVLALSLLSVACSGDGASDATGPAEAASSAVPSGTESVQRYVALGDSFTAAPFVPNVVEAEGCYRSTGNYPSLVAQRLPNAEHVDASCSGADTTNMTEPQETMAGGRVAAQFEALTEETDLVTVGIGGNDFNVFYSVVSRCAEVARNDPKGSPCRNAMQTGDGDRIERALDRTAARVTRVLEQVKKRSPEARVLLVTYPQITPGSGTCPALPIARGDYAYTREVGEWLDEALTEAAEAAEVERVDVYGASEGHDVCSDDPWVNGKDTDFTRAMSYHPFAAGQTAVAELVLETIDSAD